MGTSSLDDCCHALCLFPFSFSLQLLGYHERRDELLRLTRGSKYEVQKSRLADDFCSFLVANSAFPPPLGTSASAALATPDDVGKFLFFRDSRGRTQVHSGGCSFLGQPGFKDCGCRVGLAAGTIDSMIGKLRAFFNCQGRVNAYSPSDLLSNPCNAVFVKDWLKSAYKEQRLARITPRQAPPIFSTHLRLLAAEIARRIASLPSQSPLFPEKFCLFRDRCFFLIQWFAGDRAGDLGNAVGREVSRHSTGALVLNHTIGKTIRQNGSQTLIVPCIPEDALICPVAAFDAYVALCLSHGIDLKGGYLFPPLRRPLLNSLRNAPFTSDRATKRIRTYISDDILPHVTAHGARAGCVTTLLLLGASSEEAMDHCRWASERVFKQYHQLQRVMRVENSSNRLRVGVLASGVDSADAAASFYESLNSGANQVPAL